MSNVHQRLSRLHMELSDFSRRWPAEERGEFASQTRSPASIVVLGLLLLAAAGGLAEEKAQGVAPAAPENKIEKHQATYMAGMWERGGGQIEQLNARIREEYKAESLDALTKEQGAALLDRLRSEINMKVVPFSPAPEMDIADSPPSATSPLYFGPDFYRAVMPGVISQLGTRHRAAAAACLEQWQTRCPDDPEVQYGLALACSAAGDSKTALGHVQQALSAGLPASRFLAGPRDLLTRLHKTPGFQEMVKHENRLLVHGPSVAAVTDRTARFWVRTAKEAVVAVAVQAVEAGEVAKEASGKTTEESDWTAVLEVTGLTPNTLHQYAMTLDGSAVPFESVLTFRTFPEAGKACAFSVGFGSKSGYSPAQEGIWDAVRGRKLSAFLLMGDCLSMRGQDATLVAQRYACYRRQSSIPFRQLAASTPVYGIWDENDWGTGSGAGARDAGTLAGSLEVYRQNHGNPSWTRGGEASGMWFASSLGDATFFVLDCVSQRVRPASAPASMLGSAQKQWLLDGLKASKATFKLMASSVPWATSAAWWDAEQTWDDFAAEREEIFTFIERNKVEGVVLLSGGAVSATDVRRIPRSNGYDLYDLHSSRLTDVTDALTPGGAILTYDEGCSFGVLEFDTAQATPRLTFRMIDASGQELRNHDFALHPHDLDFEGLPDQDGLAVDLAFTKRPLVYGDGTLAEQGMIKIRLENTSAQVQEGVLHLRSVPGSIVRFPETPEYILDPGQVIERTMPIELVTAQVNDLIRIYAREGTDALRLGRKMKAPRGKSKGDDSLAAVMELVDFRFKQTPGQPLLDKEDPKSAEMGRIWFAMVDDKLVLRVVAFDAAPSRPGGRWTWNLWEGSCLEVFGVNRGQKGVMGENIAQIFIIPGIRAVPGTCITGKPMAYRLWQDFFRTKLESGLEGEPLPEVKVRDEFTNDGWIMEAMVPLNLPVFNPEQPGVPASISGKKKMIHLYADQLRIEFQLSTKLHPDEPYTHHGTMLKSRLASAYTENYAYVEWIDIAEWEDKGETQKEEKPK